MGQRPDALIKKLEQPAALPRIAETIQIGNPPELLRRRQDIRIAERTLAAATALIGIATADLFPSVTFVGTIALEASSLSELGASGSDAYAVGPRVTWADLDLGRVYARIKAADASAEASLAEYEQTVLNALEETENALVNYGSGACPAGIARKGKKLSNTYRNHKGYFFNNLICDSF